MDQNRLAMMALHFISGIGEYTLRQLISYCGSAEKVFETPKGKLRAIPGIGRVTADAISKGDAFQKAEVEFRLAEKEGAEVIFYTDKNFPSRLKQINDSPTLLYSKGNADYENSKIVGIVGTRKATDYGKRCIEELMEKLTHFQPLVVSGLAYGIDIIAHKSALKHNLPTVGVLGCGIDIMYPSIHKEVAKKMESIGGVLTENKVGTKPDAHNFPARNRIIAGLCDALIVVEAAEKGGALITAKLANGYHRDVFAFPGNIGQSYSIGCNNLIKSNEAFLITGMEDLAYLMNWSVDSPTVEKPLPIFEHFEGAEKVVLETLKSATNHQLLIDELSWQSEIAMSKLAGILLGLEFKGAISLLPGKIYKLTLK